MFNITDHSKTIVMRDSRAATEIASKLDAIHLPSICLDYSLDEVQTALDVCEDHVKVTFIDYSIHGKDTTSRKPDNVKARHKLARDIMNGRC